MPELQLNPKKTALVLIDLQNSIVGMNPVPHAAAQVVENSRKLAEAFRAHGAPVVYVRVDLNDFMTLPVDQPHTGATSQRPPQHRRLLLPLVSSMATSSSPSGIGAPSPAPTWRSSSNPGALKRSSSPVSPPT